jgi:hypothetical protein
MTTDELRKLLADAGLSQRAAARLVDLDDRQMRAMCAGREPVPRFVEYALYWAINFLTIRAKGAKGSAHAGTEKP